MGIMVPMVRAILKEHKRKPITGQGLLVGRQTIPLTIEEAKELVRMEGIPLRDVSPIIDNVTSISRDRNYIEDISFFALFSDVKLKTLDVTDYEDAEIIHDMHVPIPDEYANLFDFIWNGSCLDNMFDPAMAMRSCGRMLKNGGRLFCMEMGSPHFNAYTMFSHAWFFDYFAVNDFAECKIYSCLFEPRNMWDGPYELYIATEYNDASWTFPMKTFSNKALITFAVAEKGPNSSWEKMPLQWQYRPDHAVYRSAYVRFKSSDYFFSIPESSRSVPDRPGFIYIGTLKAIPGRRFPIDWKARIAKALANPVWAVFRLCSKIRYRNY